MRVPEREAEVIATADVVVAGGGPAGLGAQAVDSLRAAGHEVVEVVAGSLEEARAVCAALVADEIHEVSEGS